MFQRKGITIIDRVLFAIVAPVIALTFPQSWIREVVVGTAKKLKARGVNGPTGRFRLTAQERVRAAAQHFAYEGVKKSISETNE